MTTEETGALIGLLLITAAAIASIYGYIHNIIYLANMSFQNFTPELCMRVAGIPLAPLGIVMGYIH